MKDKFKNAYSTEVKQKTKTNLVLIISFSVAMMFAGLTSAYIVSMGDGFWVKVGLPTEFWISTAVIILSSITLFLATRALKKKETKKQRAFMVITLALGFVFGVFQILGYQSLIKSGAMFNTWIVVSEGRYGDYFEIKKENQFLTIENNQYYWKDEKLKGAELKDFQNFMVQFLDNEKKDLGNLEGAEKYTIYYKGEPLSNQKNTLIRPNGDALPLLDYERLQSLATNIRDNRADFFMSGEMGEDFQLYYKGKELDYKNRTLLYDGQELSKSLQNKLLRGNKDTSTAYLYILTVLHLLHVLAGIIMLINFVRYSFSESYSVDKAISIKSGVIFWHFLGGLWLYLLLFLTFIH